MFKIKKANPKDYGKLSFIAIVVGLSLGGMKDAFPSLLFFKQLGVFIFLVGIAYFIMAIKYKIKNK